VRRAKEAVDRGGTEVCIQGGLNPDLGWQHYPAIIRAIKAELPDLHIHAFSPFEIWYGAKLSKMSYTDYILTLKEAGLGSIPGTAAEILDVTIRKQLTRDKLSTDDWVTTIKTAHRVGVPTTATIMYGQINRTIGRPILACCAIFKKKPAALPSWCRWVSFITTVRSTREEMMCVLVQPKMKI